MPHDIEKTIELNAPIERVWRAISDYREFGAWFRVALDTPFARGETATGHITYPGYEHLKWEATVVAIEPPTLFAFTWHPYAIEPDADYSGETPTRVEFRLVRTADGGTRLTVTEDGFAALPAARHESALRSNEGGWTAQMENIRCHVDG